MKKGLFLALIVLGLSTVACKKCQTCTTTVTQSYNGGTPQTSKSSQEYCGKEYDDAPSEGTTSQSSGGVSQSVVITCVDK